MKFRFLLALVGAVAIVLPAAAQTAPQPEWPETWFEIFRLAPGKHEQFVRDIAKADEVAKAGGQRPIRLFFHEYGADFDVIIMKPVGEYPDPTPAQQAAMDAKAKELGLPSGPAYFVRIRDAIAEHTDTKTVGPISAAEWLARLDAWRAANPKADKPTADKPTAR